MSRDRSKKQIFLSQPDYAKSILIRFRMENCKSVSTPLESGKQFRKFSDEDRPFDKQLYQQAIGCLTYFAMSTRPDISAAVGALSQFMACPSEEHWVGVKRILRYLKGTLDYGLMFSSDGSDQVSDTFYGYSDADWAALFHSASSSVTYINSKCFLSFF